MKWSFKLLDVAGIGVFVHWTFFLLLAWIAYTHVAAGEDLALVVSGVGSILALFGCVARACETRPWFALAVAGTV